MLLVDRQMAYVWLDRYMLFFFFFFPEDLLFLIFDLIININGFSY